MTEKFKRFIVIVLLYIITWIVLYCVVPFICFIFGGSFLEIIKAPWYVGLGLIPENIILGIVFANLFKGQL